MISLLGYQTKDLYDWIFKINSEIYHIDKNKW